MGFRSEVSASAERSEFWWGLVSSESDVGCYPSCAERELIDAELAMTDASEAECLSD